MHFVLAPTDIAVDTSDLAIFEVEAMFSPVVGIYIILVIVVTESQPGYTIIGENTCPQRFPALRAFGLKCELSSISDLNLSFRSIRLVVFAANLVLVPQASDYLVED